MKEKKKNIEIKTTATTVIMGLKYSPMSEGNACIAVAFF